MARCRAAVTLLVLICFIVETTIAEEDAETIKVHDAAWKECHIENVADDTEETRQALVCVFEKLKILTGDGDIDREAAIAYADAYQDAVRIKTIETCIDRSHADVDLSWRVWNFAKCYDRK